MITIGSKYFFAITVLAVIGAVVYGWGSGGGLLGVVDFGVRGSVGEPAGYTVLWFLAAASLLVAVSVVALRDADPEALAQVAATDTVPPATPPAGANYWPAVGGFAVALVLLGLVISPALFVIGLIAGGIVVVEWTVQAWSDRATGDPEVNRQVRNRLMYPFEIPVLGVLVIGVVVLGTSRVLLALSKTGSTVVAMVAAAVILGVASLIATRPKFSRSLVAAAVVIGAVTVITGGIVAAASGERDFEHPESEEEEGGETGEQGRASIDAPLDAPIEAAKSARARGL